MARRANGEGSIGQRKDGRWFASISIGGKRRYVYGKTRRDVADQLQQIRQDTLLGVTTAPNSQTLEVYLKSRRERAEHLRPTTAYLYDLLIRVHIVPNVGHVKLKDLAPLHLNESYRRIKGARTTEQVHRLLHKALSDAVKMRLLAHNPASVLDVPKAKPKKVQFWTNDQSRAFVRSCSRYETVYDALWLFMLGSGCRIGEALGLKEEHVDWSAGSVSIEQGIVRIGTRREVSDPKTEAGVRQFLLPKFALDALKHRRRQVIDGYFFRTREGTVPWTSDLQKRLREACTRAGVPELTSHGLRKMSATLAIAAGVDVKTVQRRLGHATPAMTLGIYAQAMAQGDEKAAGALDNLLGT